MPKAVREKKRLHAPAADFSVVKNEKVEDNEFGIHLKNLETIQAELPAPEIKKEEKEEPEVETEKKPAEPKLTKDEKRKKRRDNLLQKLNYASVEIQKQKEKKEKDTPQKKKEKEKEEDETPLGLLTKDLITTLLEAEEKEERQREIKRGEPVRANHMSDKDRQDLLKKEIQQFKSVTEHPVFKANPLATITEHLTNSIALQKAKDSKDPKQKQQEQQKKGGNKNKTQSQLANEKRKQTKQQQNPKDKKSNLVSIQKSKKLEKKKK